MLIVDTKAGGIGCTFQVEPVSFALAVLFSGF